MATRGMRLAYRLLGIALVLAIAGTTYRLKHAVRGLDGELGELRHEIDRERWAMRAAQADLEYLVRPERLVMQAPQLGLVPAKGSRIVSAEAVPPMALLALAASPMPVVLPSGGAAVLLARPVALPFTVPEEIPP